MPAARAHVRYLDGAPYRFTSKLTRIAELNFTLGFDHSEAKATIAQTLARIAADYSPANGPAITVDRFMGPGNGASNGIPIRAFALEDLLAAQVIVTNNVSGFNFLPSKSPEEASAIESAVREHGRGVLGMHGSGDGGTGWPFYSEALFPLLYQETGTNTAQPVYKNEAEKGHVVLEGVLETGTVMDVPMGTDSAGAQILKPALARPMKNNWSRYARNILSDPSYKPLTTCLLRFDPRLIALSDLPSKYRFPGGNAFSFILKAGAGKSAFIQSGHDNSELTSGNGLDGGTGDLERYLAQMLFFLAGYASEPCGGTVDCAGLPVVDSLDHLTGERFGVVSLLPDAREGMFRESTGGPWRAVLSDLQGRTVAVRSGTGKLFPDFRDRALAPGLYFLRLTGGNRPMAIHRYLVPPLYR